MIKIFGVIMVMLFIICWRLPILIQTRQYRELFFFLLLCLLAGGYAMITVLDVSLVSPIGLITDIVTFFVKTVSKYIF